MSHTQQPGAWRTLTLIAAIVASLHLLGWGLLYFQDTPAIGWGTGIAAYLLGLRHAFDADHIVAIDNTTRKLIADGQRPNSVGLFFSLGHSSVVFLASVFIIAGFSFAGDQLSDESSTLRQVGGTIGGVVSGSFLLLIALLNSVTLKKMFKAYRIARSTGADMHALEHELEKRGLLARLFAPVAKAIDKPWKMYPLGFLFGLGLDTASSIGLMVLAGTSALSGGSLWVALAMPIIFAAGMALGDSVDGIFMNHVYGWAQVEPMRRAKYNLAVTSLSVVAALAVAVPVLSGVLVERFGYEPLEIVAAVSLDNMGYVLVGLFAAAWALAIVLRYAARRQGLDKTQNNR